MRNWSKSNPNLELFNWFMVTIVETKTLKSLITLSLIWIRKKNGWKIILN